MDFEFSTMCECTPLLSLMVSIAVLIVTTLSHIKCNKKENATLKDLCLESLWVPQRKPYKKTQSNEYHYVRSI